MVSNRSGRHDLPGLVSSTIFLNCHIPQAGDIVTFVNLSGTMTAMQETCRKTKQTILGIWKLCRRTEQLMCCLYISCQYPKVVGPFSWGPLLTSRILCFSIKSTSASFVHPLYRPLGEVILSQPEMKNDSEFLLQ